MDGNVLEGMERRGCSSPKINPKDEKLHFTTRLSGWRIDQGKPYITLQHLRLPCGASFANAHA